MIPTANVSALIVAKPGRLRDSLKAVLRTIPYLTVIGQADDAGNAIPLVAKLHPQLLLVGPAFPSKQMETLLATTKLRSPQTRCMVLVDTMEQWWLAKSAGADSVLLSGFTSIKFCATIENLMLQQNVP